MATTETTYVQETEPLNSPPNNSENTKNDTVYGRLKNIAKNVTVEPIAFMALFSSVFASVATQTLALEKACRVSLNLSDVICDSLRIQNQSNNFSVYERMVQEHYSTHLMWKSALQSLLPCLLLIFIGGWSDKTGRRKVIMLAPVIGSTFQSLSNIINVIFFYQLPLQVLIFFDVFFANITGGTSVMFLALFNYICDITTAETRTHRLGLINLCTFAGIPIGLSMSGIVLKQFGYYAIYGSALTIDVINIIYIMLRITDIARTKEQKMYDGKGLLHFLRSFFDFTTIRDTIKVVCKETRDNRRLRLCVLLVVVTFLYGPIFGEVAVLYMSVRYRFNWDEIMFSIFQTYNFIATTIGTVISITLFSKYLKWHDSVMGIISAISRIASSFVFCFAANEKIFFIGPIIDMFNGTALLALRSIYSKLLEPNEIGKFSSLMGLIENLTPLAYVSMYTQVYTATMDTLPGAVYLLGAVMTIPSIFVFIWLLCQHKGDVRRDNTDKANEIPLT